MATTSAGDIQLGYDGDLGVATITLAMQGGVNKINQGFSTQLAEALRWALVQQGIGGIIIASAHRDFCVGADLDMLYGQNERDQLQQIIVGFQSVLRTLESCGVPVVAALTGSALGGGYEIALACHRRIAIDRPGIKVGLPEVTLGVLPAAGGTQRLPRLVGLQLALDYVVQGKTVDSKRALADGLIDDLCSDAAEVTCKARAWIKGNRRIQQLWDRKGFAYPPPAPGTPAANDLFLAASGVLYRKTAGAMEAPKLAMSAICEGTQLSFDRGLEVELRYFLRLATGGQSKDIMRTVWYHRQAADKLEGLPKIDDPAIAKVGIVGAGMMGAGLAYLCAERGLAVVLKDVGQPVLDKAMARCRKLAGKRAKDEAEVEALLGRIHPTLALEPLRGCDLAIEAVFEDIALKRRVIEQTQSLLAEGGIWASNTSALPINDLARVSSCPERLIGMHFFSPVERMPLLEVVVGDKTSEQTLARALALGRALRKTPIVVRDGYGFYTTRVFTAYILEGAELLAEGHQPALIEHAARAAGMAVGPLQVFDEVSLTLGRQIIDERRTYLGMGPQSPGERLVVRMVEERGRCGKARGQGFYEYPDGRRSGLWPGLRDLVSGVSAPSMEPQGVEPLGQRLLLIQSVEAVRILEAGVLQRKRDAELGAVFGLGFALNTGGPLSYLDRLGIAEAVSKLRELAVAHGERYAPPQLLVTMAEQGECFFGKSQSTS